MRTQDRPGANDVVPPAPDAATLTIGEASYLLRVSPTTTRRLVDEGELPSIAIRGRVLVSRRAVDHFLRMAEATKAPTSEAVDAIRAAEAKALTGVRLGARVVADWNKGPDPIDLDAYIARQEARKARQKAKAST